jgi:hypothetical protein
VLGCGKAQDKGSGAKQSEAVAQFSAKDLPSLGQYLPPLDDGRIEVAGPAGWSPAPRKTFIARFVRKEGESYPTIIVDAEDCRGVTNVSKDNVEKFADWVAKQANAKQATPVVIGGFVGAAYRKRGKQPGSMSQIIDCLRLDTVVDGRKYTVELRARDGELDSAREQLYSVANGLKFPKAEGKSALPSPEEVAAAETEPGKAPEAGAEEKPAEETPGAPKVEAEPPQPSKEEAGEAKEAAEEPPKEGAEEEAGAEPDEEPKPAKETEKKVDLDKELEGLFD